MISFHRMILFTAQAMSYLYVMTTFNNQDATCLPLFGFAILFLVEMVIRLSQFCDAGEGLYAAVRNLRLRIGKVPIPLISSPSISYDARLAYDQN